MGAAKGFRGLVPGTSRIVVILDEVDVKERNVECYSATCATLAIPVWFFFIEGIALLKC